MYQSHWGLRESPFHEGHDPQAFYQSPTHEEALARLHFLVEQRRRLGLLLGPEGSGKSLLLELLAADLRRHGPVVAQGEPHGHQRRRDAVVDPGPVRTQPRPLRPDAGALAGAQRPFGRLPLSAGRCGGPRRRRRSRGQLGRAAPHPARQAGASDAGLRGAAAADDGPGGQSPAHRPPGRNALGPVRVAHRPGRLAARRHRRLSRHLAARGGSGREFDEQAIERLYELSHGVPRQVRLLADLSLVAGAGRHLQSIDAEVVDTVYHELAMVEA